MPRLTNQQYLTRRRVVLREWHERGGGSFGFLTLAEQRAVHDYFGTVRELTASQVVAFRREVTLRRPSLAQIAGRAYKNLEMAIGYVPVSPVQVSTVTKTKKNISVQLIVRPEINVHRLARALVMLADAKRKT